MFNHMILDILNNETIIVLLSYTKSNYTFLCKQPVYKQLALGWQFVKQLLRPNPHSLSSN